MSVRVGEWTVEQGVFYHHPRSGADCGGLISDDKKCTVCDITVPAYLLALQKRNATKEPIARGVDSPAPVEYDSPASTGSEIASTTSANTTKENETMADETVTDDILEEEQEAPAESEEEEISEDQLQAMVLDYIAKNPNVLPQGAAQPAGELTFEIHPCATERYRNRNYVDVTFNRKPTDDEHPRFIENGLKANGFTWLRNRGCWSGPAKTLVDSDIYGEAVRPFLPASLKAMLK